MARLAHYWGDVLRRVPAEIPTVGAEVGVWRGRLSERLLQARPLLTLWLVDPWDAGLRGPRYDQAACDSACANVEKLAGKYGERVQVVRAVSLEAVRSVEADSLDFFFLDGDHSRAAVSADIRAWLPKLKPGGWYGGRDFVDRWYWDRLECESFRRAAEPGVDRTWFVSPFWADAQRSQLDG